MQEGRNYEAGLKIQEETERVKVVEEVEKCHVQ